MPIFKLLLGHSFELKVLSLTMTDSNATTQLVECSSICNFIVFYPYMYI